MTILTLALLLPILFVAAYGLFQWIYQRQAHEQLEQERRRRFMQRHS